MSMKDLAIVIAGFGGQGILSAGRIVADAALLEGREVSWFPSYGPEMRGGTANCSVVLSDEVIGSPVVNEPDVLVALNGPSAEKFAGQVKSGGLIILDSTLVSQPPSRGDVTILEVPASKMASDRGNMTFAAIYLLGCLSGQTGCFSRSYFEKALYDSLPERHHHLIPMEMDVFDEGHAYAKPPSG